MHKVVAMPFEDRMVGDPEPDVQVTRRAAPGSNGPPTGHPQPAALVDAGRNLDRMGRPLDDPPRAVALRTRVLDRLASTAAGRTDGGGHHLPERRLADPSHLAPTRAAATSIGIGAGLCSARLAGNAGHGRADGDLGVASEHGILEAQVEDHLEVLARDGAALSSAEATPSKEGFEEVAEAAEGVGRSAHAATVVAETVVAGPALGIGKRLVGGGRILEACLGPRVAGIGVGMLFSGQATVGLLDLVD